MYPDLYYLYVAELKVVITFFFSLLKVEMHSKYNLPPQT